MAVTVDSSKTLTVAPGYVGSGTFAQMKAVTGMADGATYLVTEYGRGGTLWRYSASLTEWFPIAPAVPYENTALITGLAQAAEQVLLPIPAAAYLLASKIFRLRVSFGKNGTNDAAGAFRVRMGTAGTTADTEVINFTPSLTAGQRSVGFDFWFRMASATSVEKLGGPAASPFVNTGSGTLLNAATTIANVTTQATFITLTTAMGGTTDSPQLGYVALEIQP